MKKVKLRLGSKDHLWAIYGMLIMTLLIIFWYLLKSRLNFLFLASFIIFLLVTVFDGDFAFIELCENDIILKRLFHKTRKYNKEELVFRCAVKKVDLRYGSRLDPCLMIGKLKESHFYFDISQMIYEDYFLIVVDSDKKRDIITRYFNQKIELPDKEQWNKYKEDFTEKVKNSIGIRRTNLELQKMDEFYELIEQYNKSI